MKVHQIVPSIFNQSDGVANCVRNLSAALVNRQIDIEVHSLYDIGITPKNLVIKTYRHSLFPTDAIGRSPEMERGIKKSVQANDIVHAHGLWMQPTVYGFEAAKKIGCKFCLEIHGTLSNWALKTSRLKKFISLNFLGQKSALKNADLLIATCEDEYKDIRNFGLHNPVAIIPNGVQIPSILSPKIVLPYKQMIFLSRIHKKKGLDILLKSWKLIQENHLDWELVIAGPINNSHAQELIQLSELTNCDRVKFIGEIHGNQISEILSKAYCFVLPTHSENFGIAIAEALACGTSVITTTGAPWSGLVDNDCGLWITLSVDNLTDALHDMMSRPLNQLAAMGHNGREWMRRDFSWDEIAQKTVRAYEWLLNPAKADQPDFIKLD